LASGPDDGAHQGECVRVAEVPRGGDGIAFEVLAQVATVRHDEVAGEAAGRDVGEQLADRAPATVDGRGVYAGPVRDDRDRQLVLGVLDEQLLDGLVHRRADPGGTTARP